VTLCAPRECAATRCRECRPGEGIRPPERKATSMRLLLVEDNLQLAEWLSRTLRRQKYTVDCVATGQDADHVLQTEAYDMVILDLALPDLSGLEILRRLRAR